MNPDIKEAIYQFEIDIIQRLYNTNSKVESVCSGDFYLDNIYEDDPAYRDKINAPNDSDYNAPYELPDAYYWEI